MALTKVSGGILDPGINVAGIVTATGFDGPFIGGIGDHIIAGIVTATGLDINGNADISGSLTVGSGGLDLNGSGDISGDLVIHGNLTANGDFTTLNTTLREVELLKVDADSNTTAGIITQRGTGDILNLFDGTTEVLTVKNGGLVGIKTDNPDQELHVVGQIKVDDSNYARVEYARNDTNLWSVGLRDTDDFWFFRESGAANVIFQHGKVGIGSTIPSEKLDVVGVTSFTGDVFFKGGVTTPAPRDMFWDYSASQLRFKDNASIYLGSNNDAFFSHDGSSTRLQDTYGHFFIGGNLIQMKSGNLGEEYIRMDNTSKEVKLFHNSAQRLNTTAQGINVTTVGDVPQVSIAQTTTGAYSINGTLSFVNANNTTAQIQGRTGAASTTGDIIFLCNTVGDETLAVLEDGKVRVPDRGRFVVGSGNDLSLYHDNGGSGSHIQNSGSNLTVRTTGTYLYIHGNNIHLRSQTGNETMLTAVVNSAVALYYDASTYTTPKLQTTSTGTQIDTILKLNGAAGNPGKLQLQEGGALSEIRVERSTDTSSSLLFGTEISGTTATRWKIDTAGHLLTASAGAYDIGTASAEIGNVYIADDKRIYLGSDQNLSLRHDSSTGINKLVSNPGTMFYMSATNYFTDAGLSKIQAQFIHNSYCELRHAGDLRIRTSETGIDVTGEVKATQDYPLSQPTVDFNFAAEKKLDPRITYQRTGVASFLNKFGKIELVGWNTPRFDYDPITRESKGLLIEESRTNMFWGTRNIGSYGRWAVGGARGSQGENVEGPDGTLTALQNVYNGTSGDLNIYYTPGVISTANNNYYTFSVFAKAEPGNSYINGIRLRTYGPERSVSYNVINGTVGATNEGSSSILSKTIVPYPNGWYRCIMTFTSGTDGNQGFQIYVENEGGDNAALNNSSANGEAMYFWGAQLELGGFVTSFIPTPSLAAATRGQDLVEITEEEFSEFYNRTEGSFVSEIMLKPSFPVTGYATVMMSLSDGSFNNRVTLASSTGSAAFNADVNIGSGTPTRAALGSYTSGSYSIKAAMAYKASDTAGSLNGAAAVTSSPSGTLPLLTRADIGKDHQNGNLLNGHVKRIMYYPKRLPNNQLRTLTA